jgi:SEC-C motif-containing protein
VRGEREAESAEALMRSRYVAYATGAVDHLVRTLHPEHVERSIGEQALLAQLRLACSTYRYMGLEVRAHEERGDEAFVVFRARVFEKGRDRSFAERSRFARVDGAWRYLDGTTEPA